MSSFPTAEGIRGRLCVNEGQDQQINGLDIGVTFRPSCSHVTPGSL